MDNNNPNQKPGNSGKSTGWQAFISIGQLGLHMGVCIIGGFFAGLYLDRWLDTAPWLLVIMTLLGVGASFKALFEYALK